MIKTWPGLTPLLINSLRPWYSEGTGVHGISLCTCQPVNIYTSPQDCKAREGDHVLLPIGRESYVLLARPSRACIQRLRQLNSTHRIQNPSVLFPDRRQTDRTVLGCYGMCSPSIGVVGVRSIFHLHPAPTNWRVERCQRIRRVEHCQRISHLFAARFFIYTE